VFGCLRALAGRRLSQLVLGCTCVSLIGCGASHSTTRNGESQHGHTSTVATTAAAVTDPAQTSTRRPSPHSPLGIHSASKPDPASSAHSASKPARQGADHHARPAQRTSLPRPGPTTPRPDRGNRPLARTWQRAHRTIRAKTTRRHAWSAGSRGSVTRAAPQASASAPQSTASGW